MRLRQVVAFVASTAVAGCARSADSPVNPRLLEELTRLETLQQTLEQSKLAEPFAGLVAPNRKALDAAMQTDDERLRLYRTRAAFIGIETLSFVARHDDAAKDIDALATLWASREEAFDSLASTKQGSLLSRALVEAGVNRAEKLYRASLPYGRVSGAASGLYYLAEAEGSARFAQFVAGMPPEPNESAPSQAALRVAIDSLEADALALFETDRTSGAAIPASAALKEARELFERGSLAGATLLAAEARLAIARRSATEATLAVSAQPAPGGSIAETFRAMNDPIVARSVLPFLASLRRKP